MGDLVGKRATGIVGETAVESGLAGAGRISDVVIGISRPDETRDSLEIGKIVVGLIGVTYVSRRVELGIEIEFDRASDVEGEIVSFSRVGS